MKRFLLFCLLLCLPVLASLVVYVVIDPFKVIGKYENYYQPTDFVSVNRGYVSAMHFINTKDSRGYNSFIFGNSRSIAFHEKEWKKYISNSAVCYHFDEFVGSVGHLFYEMDYVRKYCTIENALIVLDPGMLSRTTFNGHLYDLCPALNDNHDYIKFHLDNYKAFYCFGFLRSYIDYILHGEYKPYMMDYIIDKAWERSYDPSNNEMSWTKQEESIARGDYYDAKRRETFNVQFPYSVYDIAIDDERMELLLSISKLLNEQHTNYRIVLSPEYNQRKINPLDLKILYKVFGQQFVYDFTGVNQWTGDYHNYYDNSHYRSCVANEIMRLVYSEQP